MTDAASICPQQRGAVLPFQVSHVATWRVDDRDGHGKETCSYCGSLHPDAFMAAAEAGLQLTPTDKSYKVYVDLPRGDVGQPVVSGMGAVRSGGGWVTASEEHRALIERTWMKESADRAIANGEAILISAQTATNTEKFYFEHLSEDQKQRFVELLNAGTLKLAAPGYFYAAPFFIRFGPKSDAA